jgi:hypothetical protein
MRVANDIPLGCPLILPVGTVNYVETLKVCMVQLLVLSAVAVMLVLLLVLVKGKSSAMSAAATVQAAMVMV